MRLKRTLFLLVMATLALLLVSGGVWWSLDEFQRAGWRWLLAVHGGSAMAALLVLGAVLGHHALLSWRRKVNRASGAVLAFALGALTVTAFILYYSGSDAVREQASLIHTILGAALPVLLFGHMIIGRLAVRRQDYGDNEAV